MSRAGEISIEVFARGDDRHRQKFAELNREWLDSFGFLEPADEAVLADPEGAVLDKDGLILFASVDGEILGTGALLKYRDGIYEIAKMGVAAAARGQGIGRRLVESLIAGARARGARKLHIESNRKLDRALALYRSLGFTELPETKGSRYASCDIIFELILSDGANETEGLDPTRYGDWEIKGKCIDF